MITNWDDKINFGKYKGWSVKEVFEDDATYLRWAMINTDRVNFEKDVKEAIQKHSAELDYANERDLDWGDFYT